MKLCFRSFFIIVAALTTIVACDKEADVQVDENGKALVELTIVADNPEAQPATKTEMVGTTPYWSVGDAIGVSDGTSTNAKFITSITAAATTASFTGSTVAGTLYAYYPYSSSGVGNSGAKVDLPASQSPTATSFDGAADIMVAKQFTVTDGTTKVENLEFARLGAIVKIVLKDTENTMTSAQYPTTVSMTAESDLVGRVYVDMVNQNLGEIYYNNSKTVTANYSSATKFEINGTNAAYLVVYPQTIAAGSKLTISASTADYSIEKEITVPNSGIELLPGKVTTLNISLAASQITADSGDQLPFSDNMSWADNGASDGVDISSSISTESDGLYISASKAYKGIGGIKLGTSSANGYIITKELDLSGQFYIAVKGEKWDGDLVVTVDETEVINEPFGKVNYINVASGTYTNKSKVKIATSTKRGRLYSVIIDSGEYVPDPTISVSSDNPIAVGNVGGSYTIAYSITNPRGGSSLIASTEEAWITDINYSTNGEVSFTVSAQESGAATRVGSITLSYPDADDVIVTVNQEAAKGGKGSADNPLTASEASELALSGSTAEVHVKGIISSISTEFNPQFNNISFYISESGTSNDFQIYRGTATSADQFLVGDYVVFHGALATYNSAGQMGAGGACYSQVKAPRFTPDGGSFTTDSQSVNLTADNGATIYYSLNGSEPTLEYSETLNLTTTTTVKAKAVLGDIMTGVVSREFTKSSGTEETSTLTFTAKCNGVGTDDHNVVWTVTSDGTESTFESTKGIHYGTNSAAVQYIKLSTSGITGTITKVVVNASTASGVSATASVTVGGSAFGGDAQSLSSSATDYTFNGSAKGEIIVTVTKPSSATKAIYVKSVTVTYTPSN